MEELANTVMVMIYINQCILHNVICQLYVNKTGHFTYTHTHTMF